MPNLKLQKQLSRQHKGIDYPKYIVTIPPKLIEEVAWQPGLELIAKVENGRIIIEPKRR